MARRPRDYKAEYARRKAREYERARLEGRKPSLARARGHRDYVEEKERRIYWKLIRKLDIPKEDAKEPLGRYPTYALNDTLRETLEARERYMRRGDPGFGHAIWLGKNDDLPDAFYWYHGGF